MTSRIVSMMGLALLTAAAGCNQPTMDPNVVTIGSTKPVYFGLPKEFRALHAGLEKHLERPVRFVAQSNGESLGMQLEQGNYACALMSSLEYSQVADPSGLTLVASALNSAGKTSRKGFILARKGCEVKSIADCKGRRFAFGAHGDLLTDIAARAALEKGGVPVGELLAELLTPPPFGRDGRLYMGKDVAKTILQDPTVDVGVVDELAFQAMPDTGGNFIRGPSKDQFVKLGETEAVPEMVVVASASADRQTISDLREYLLEKVGDDSNVCSQLGVTGFVRPDRAAYDHLHSARKNKE